MSQTSGPSQRSQHDTEMELFNEFEARQREVTLQDLGDAVRQQDEGRRAMKESRFNKAWSVRGSKTELEEWSTQSHQVSSCQLTYFFRLISFSLAIDVSSRIDRASRLPAAQNVLRAFSRRSLHVAVRLDS
jgi:hypothetical protein